MLPPDYMGISSREDHALVTALVERWHQETHSFHLPVGEDTVTLQDVDILLSLRVDGRPVTSHPMHDCGPSVRSY